MHRFLDFLGKIDDDRGQTLTEYALILALIALTLVLGLQALGGGVDGVFSTAAGLF
jgi:Flp pilus assembly pilin Flp